MPAIQSLPYLRDLSPLEIELFHYVAHPKDVTTVTAEDVINQFADTNEETRMEVALAVAYLTENLYIARDPRTLALTTNSL